MKLWHFILVAFVIFACVYVATFFYSISNIDYDCADFKTRSEAKKVYDSRPGDPYRLDGDHDGIPCESLPEIA